MKRRTFMKATAAAVATSALPPGMPVTSAPAALNGPAPAYGVILRRIQDFAYRTNWRNRVFAKAIYPVECCGARWAVASDAMSLLAVRDFPLTDPIADSVLRADEKTIPLSAKIIAGEFGKLRASGQCRLGDLRDFCGPPQIDRHCPSCNGYGDLLRRDKDGCEVVVECVFCDGSGRENLFTNIVCVLDAGFYGNRLAWTLTDLPADEQITVELYGTINGGMLRIVGREWVGCVMAVSGVSDEWPEFTKWHAEGSNG